MSFCPSIGSWSNTFPPAVMDNSLSPGATQSFGPEESRLGSFVHDGRNSRSSTYPTSPSPYSLAWSPGNEPVVKPGYLQVLEEVEYCQYDSLAGSACNAEVSLVWPPCITAGTATDLEVHFSLSDFLMERKRPKHIAVYMTRNGQIEAMKLVKISEKGGLTARFRVKFDSPGVVNVVVSLPQSTPTFQALLKAAPLLVMSSSIATEVLGLLATMAAEVHETEHGSVSDFSVPDLCVSWNNLSDHTKRMVSTAWATFFRSFAGDLTYLLEHDKVNLADRGSSRSEEINGASGEEGGGAETSEALVKADVMVFIDVLVGVVQFLQGNKMWASLVFILKVCTEKGIDLFNGDQELSGLDLTPEAIQALSAHLAAREETVHVSREDVRVATTFVNEDMALITGTVSPEIFLRSPTQSSPSPSGSSQIPAAPGTTEQSAGVSSSPSTSRGSPQSQRVSLPSLEMCILATLVGFADPTDDARFLAFRCRQRKAQVIRVVLLLLLVSVGMLVPQTNARILLLTSVAAVASGFRQWTSHKRPIWWAGLFLMMLRLVMFYLIVFAGKGSSPDVWALWAVAAQSAASGLSEASFMDYTKGISFETIVLLGGLVLAPSKPHLELAAFLTSCNTTWAVFSLVGDVSARHSFLGSRG